MTRCYAAVDVGASGGRVVAATVSARGVELDVVHRFPNSAKEIDGSLHWDVASIFDQICLGLSKLADRGDEVVSIGIDTWAVDYALLDDDGELVGVPYAYRDDRTDPVVDDVHATISRERLYAITGVQYLPFNTVYQLAAEQRGDRWAKARRLLLLPDLFAYWLCGVQQTEMSNASTTALFDATAHDWSAEIGAALGLPDGLLAPIRPSGTVLAPITATIAERTGLSPDTVVTTVGSHDTASAVVAVPAEVEDFGYVSSGTWSLVGIELAAPVLTEASRDANFTNEGGVDGRIRYLRNAGGLWLLQECLREWGDADLQSLLDEAAELSDGPLIDVDAEEFIAPNGMERRIMAACRRTGQEPPSARAEVVRCILLSLASAYGSIIAEAERLSGRAVQVVHVVGGGSQNALLCRLTARACARPVVAGPVEATAIGNVLVQARAHGDVDGSLEDLRALVRAGSTLTTYSPDDLTV